MTAPIRSMPEPLATADCYDALIEALRARKAVLGLSDATVDELGGLASGHTGYILGPSRTKSLSPMTLDVLLAVLAVKIQIVEDPDATKVVEDRWKRRVESHVRTHAHRMSTKLLTQAKPLIFKEMAKLATVARKDIPRDIRIKIARKAAVLRWREVRKKRREAKMVPEVVT